eukprot:gnl/Chilomastix_cuspidata/4050.p1 GENE.gnl/Chilomastix_cuspidata/4050~~gnl/Chilomastix_cuspidata/4050.p1  ORF type:complete len:410 (+),score=175.90 gnl/Chilomastix_cuspidata/4050:95-1231(+)
MAMHEVDREAEYLRRVEDYMSRKKAESLQSEFVGAEEPTLPGAKGTSLLQSLVEEEIVSESETMEEPSESSGLSDDLSAAFMESDAEAEPAGRWQEQEDSLASDDGELCADDEAYERLFQRAVVPASAVRSMEPMWYFEDVIVGAYVPVSVRGQGRTRLTVPCRVERVAPSSHGRRLTVDNIGRAYHVLIADLPPLPFTSRDFARWRDIVRALGGAPPSAVELRRKARQIRGSRARDMSVLRRLPAYRHVLPKNPREREAELRRRIVLLEEAPLEAVPAHLDSREALQAADALAAFYRVQLAKTQRFLASSPLLSPQLTPRPAQDTQRAAGTAPREQFNLDRFTALRDRILWDALERGLGTEFARAQLSERKAVAFGD